jgi:hypothetical protein
MAEYEDNHGGVENPFGQRIVYRTYLREGDSVAERRAAVVVSGKVVVKGWNCGGLYGVYMEFVSGERSTCGHCGKEIKRAANDVGWAHTDYADHDARRG